MPCPASDWILLYRASGTLNLAQGAYGALAVLIGWGAQPGLPGGAPAGTGDQVSWRPRSCACCGGGWSGRAMANQDPVVRATATLGPALMVLGLCNWHWNDKARTLRLPSDDPGFVVAGVRVSMTQVLVLVLAVVVTGCRDVAPACDPHGYGDARASRATANFQPAGRQGPPGSRCSHGPSPACSAGA